MRILIVRVSSLGDVVHNMPVLADIHRHYPDAIIDWVVEESYVGLVRLNKHVNEVIPFALRRWKKNIFSSSVRKEFSLFLNQLRSRSYDYVFDTQGLIKTGLAKQIALTKNGKEYGSLTLQDKTGTVDAKIWELNSPGINEFAAMDYVFVDADVTVFQGAFQLNVKRIRKRKSRSGSSPASGASTPHSESRTGTVSIRRCSPSAFRGIRPPAACTVPSAASGRSAPD